MQLFGEKIKKENALFFTKVIKNNVVSAFHLLCKLKHSGKFLFIIP